MKIPRDLSGARLADVLCRKWEYARVHQVGSHIIMETAQPIHHRIAVPDHHPLRLGTLTSILRAVAQHKGVQRDATSRTFKRSEVTSRLIGSNPPTAPRSPGLGPMYESPTLTGNMA